MNDSQVDAAIWIKPIPVGAGIARVCTEHEDEAALAAEGKKRQERG